MKLGEGQGEPVAPSSISTVLNKLCRPINCYLGLSIRATQPGPMLGLTPCSEPDPSTPNSTLWVRSLNAESSGTLKSIVENLLFDVEKDSNYALVEL